MAEEEAPITTLPPPAKEATPVPRPEPEESSDLMGSAKILAEAAQAAASKNTDKIDKEKVSEAAEDVLEAARSGLKLDEKEGVGQYLGKAEGYLHSMHGAHGKEEDTEKETVKEKEEESSGGGVAGGLMKMAGGFFK